jgi:hypothetical protein
MAVPKVLVLVRQRVAGKRAYVSAQDDKGKLLQLPGTCYLPYSQHGKSQWQRIGSFIEVPSAKLALERHLTRLTAALEHDLPLPTPSGGSGHSCQMALDAYLAARESRGEPSGGIGERRHDITLFLRFSGKAALEEITRHDYYNFIAHI